LDFSPLADLFREEVIPTSSSPKLKRPRAPFYLEAWCPWMRAKTPSASYLYSPHKAEKPSPEFSGRLIASIRKELGGAGFYHRFLIRKLWGFSWKKIASMSGNPEIPSSDLEGGSEEEELDAEVLVIAGEGGAVSFANASAELSKGKIIMIPTRPLKELEREAGESLAGEVEVLESSYLGMFEDGAYALSREKRKIYRLKAGKLAFSTGMRDSFPIFENNDLPGIVSSQLALRLMGEHSALRKVKKIAVLVGDERGLEIAKELSRMREVIPIAVGSFAGSGAAREAGAVPAQEIEAKGYPKLEGVEVRSPGSESFEVELLASALRTVPEIEPLLQLGSPIMFSRRIAAVTAATDEGMRIESSKSVFFFGEASGTPRELAKEEAELAAKLMAGRNLSSEDERRLKEIRASKQLQDPGEVVLEAPPLFLLARSANGMKFVCPCQDVTLEDLLRAYDMGYRDIERLKRFTALGTGSCQGRICRFSAALLLSYFRRVSLGSLGSFRQRPPLEPVEATFLS